MTGTVGAESEALTGTAGGIGRAVAAAEKRGGGTGTGRRGKAMAAAPPGTGGVKAAVQVEGTAVGAGRGVKTMEGADRRGEAAVGVGGN